MSLIFVSPKKSGSIRGVGWKILNWYGLVRPVVTNELAERVEYAMELSFEWSKRNSMIISKTTLNLRFKGRH